MARPVPVLTLLGRGYCHLCDDMLKLLEPLSRVEGFGIEVIDVDAEPELEARFGEKVPVLLLGDTEICHYFLDTTRLAEVLAADQLK